MVAFLRERIKAGKKKKKIDMMQYKISGKFTFASVPQIFI